MGEMPKNRIKQYNNIIIEFGWIVLFAPAFPLASFVAILSNTVTIKTIKDRILSFNRRGIPKSAIDIGSWLDFLEVISTLGIVNSVGLVIFTSK